jgi:hypothetical protein
VQEVLAATVARRQRYPYQFVEVAMVPTRGRAGRTPCKKWEQDEIWECHGVMQMVGELMASMLQVVMMPWYLLAGWTEDLWFRPEQRQQIRTAPLVGGAGAFAAVPGLRSQYLWLCRRAALWSRGGQSHSI